MVLRSEHVEGGMGFEMGESWGMVEDGGIEERGDIVPGIGTTHDEHFLVLDGLHIS